MRVEDADTSALPTELPPHGALQALWRVRMQPILLHLCGQKSKANRLFYDYFRPLFRRMMPDEHFMNYGLWREPADDGKNPAQRLFAFLLSHADIAPQHRVLHVGSGLGGPDRELLSTQTFASLVSLEHNPTHLAIAQQYLAAHGLLPRPDVRFVCGDAMALSASALHPESIDRVLACECVDEFPSRRRFYQEAWRVLTPGGALVSADVFLDRVPGDHATQKRIHREATTWGVSHPFYSRADLERDLRATGFTSVAFHSFAQWVWTPFLAFVTSEGRAVKQAEALGYPPVARRMLSDYLRSLDEVAQYYDYAVVVAQKEATATGRHSTG
jgi:predicted O-methyltransferase YrrM